jgi:hypothetical protein
MKSPIKAWRERRQARRRAMFQKAFNDPNSLVRGVVYEYANHMARGIVMRWFDDRRIRRCACCVSTDQLIKRELGKPPKVRVVFLCPAHKDTPLPEPGSQNGERST